MSEKAQKQPGIKRKRLWPIFLNGTRTVLTPAIALLIALFVIQSHSKAFWGDFVPFLLYFHFANIITNWGSKDYLMREFSQNPGNTQKAWQSVFLARIPLLILSQLFVLVFFPITESLYLISCLGLAYVSHSFLPIINDQRHYSRVILVELLGFICFVLLLLMQRETRDFLVLLQTYTLYQGVRSVLFILIYRLFLRKIQWRFDLKYLIHGLPFFLLAFTGFLQAKVDLYIFRGFSSKIELADYQIISGFLIFLQGIATILLMPYVRNIYRLKRKVLLRIATFLGWVGIPLTITAIWMLYIILSQVFNIHLDIYQVGCVFLIAYPSFLYAVHVFYGFGASKEKQVLRVSLISALTNGLLSIVFLSLGLNITGVLLAHGIAQVVALVGFRSLLKNDHTTQKNQ